MRPGTTQARGHRRPYAVGILLLLITAGLWSLNGALIKLTYDAGEGPHGILIAFYRSLIAAVFLLPFAWGKFHTLGRRSGAPTGSAVGSRHGLGDRNPQVRRVGLLSVHRVTPLSLRPAALACVVFFTLMTCCFVVATTWTEAVNAIVLQYTSTFWIFGLSPLVLGEKPRPSDLWLLALAMIGIAIIFAGRASTDLPGLVVALGSGLFFGLETLMIRRLRDADSAAVIVLCLFGSAVLLLPLALLTGSLMVSERSWVLLLALGIVQFGLPYYLYALALVRVPAYQVALITLAEPVLNPVWVRLCIGEAVPVTTAVGGAVILLALVLFLRATRGESRKCLTKAPEPSRGDSR